MWTACSVSNPVLLISITPPLYGYLYLLLSSPLALPHFLTVCFEYLASLCFSLNVFILELRGTATLSKRNNLAVRAPSHARKVLIELPIGYGLFVIAIWTAAPRWLEWSLVSGVTQLLNPAVISSGWDGGVTQSPVLPLRLSGRGHENRTPMKEAIGDDVEAVMLIWFIG